MPDWWRCLAALTYLMAAHSQARRHGADQHRRGGFRHGCLVLTVLILALMMLAVMILAAQPVLLMRVPALPVRRRRQVVRYLLWRPVRLAVFAKYRPGLASARHVPDG